MPLLRPGVIKQHKPNQRNHELTRIGVMAHLQAEFRPILGQNLVHETTTARTACAGLPNATGET